jgi:hypothetical protein
MAERQELTGACKNFEQDLVLYFYQDCSRAEQQQVEAHLEGCPSCRVFLEELKSLLPATVKPDEPTPAFWQNYSREMRGKLDKRESRGWAGAIMSLFRPWPVPAVATAMILAIAVTLTFTKGRWTTETHPSPELVEMASNADFFESIDFLDSMDLLESVEGHDAQKSETASHPL